MMIATTSRKYFNELLKNPLFFMERKCEFFEKQNQNCKEIGERYFYKSARTEISAFISEEKIVNEILHLKEYVLLVVENEVENNQNKSDSVTFSFHIANSQYDLIAIINSLIIRSQNVEDKYPFMYLLWFLNHNNWTTEQLKTAIGQYDIRVQPYIFKWLRKICRCLSYQKQQQIKKIAHYFNFEYEIYLPSQITDALKYVTPKISDTNCHLFDLIDHIFGDDDDFGYCDKDGNIRHYID